VSNRRRKGKLKLEHHLIDGLRPVLDELCTWPEVRTCIPGRIRVARSRSGPFLTVSSRTPTGVKVIAHGGSAVQEVFVVTGDPDGLTERIAAREAR
jgi:hypothetical protein